MTSEQIIKTASGPTPDQIRVLRSDWLAALGRDGRFVHRNISGAMLHRTDGGALSDDLTGLTDSDDTVEAIRRARRVAENIVNTMVNERVRIEVGSDASYSSLGMINIATDYFDSPELSAGEKADVMAGLAVHEAAHLVHTDFSELDRMLNKGDGLDSLRKDISNILEDERIEWLTGEEMPGFADYLAKTKDWFFRKGAQRLAAAPPSEDDRLARVINALVLAVRFPAALDDATARAYWEELSALRKALTPFPMSNQAVWDVTERVVDILKDLVRKNLEKKKNGESKDGNGNGNAGSPGKDAPSGQGENRKNGKDGQGAGNGKDSGVTQNEIRDEILRQACSSAGRKASEASQTLSSQSHGRPADASRSLTNGTKTAKDIANDRAETERPDGCMKSTVLIRAEGKRNDYESAARAVKKYVPAMRRALACRSFEQDYELRGLPSGHLNTNKLASLKAGNANIFDKQTSVTVEGAAVCLLIDESGSMQSNGKYLAARRAAVLVEQSLRDIPSLQFFAYGYTTHEYMAIYAEGGKSNRYALGSTRHCGGTPTGTAMRVAARRVRKHYGGRCLMLVITDGEPNGNENVAAADSDLRKHGFHPVGIGIDADVMNLKTHFRDSVLMTDIAKLPLFLGKLTKKYLSDMFVYEEN